VVDCDYIVVGGGTAGCVLAARLSERPDVRVLLLEAGSAERTPAMTVPNAWPQNLGSAAEWGNRTAPQADAGPIILPRGKALGGSSAINAMAHIRGHIAVYDAWAAAGATGWAFSDLLPYFKRSEQADGRDPALRGIDGPIRVAPALSRHPVAEAFATELMAAGYPQSDDLSGENQEGPCWVDLAIADGQRVSSADGYLRPVLGRQNLVVETDSPVTSLSVRNGRCIGVTYLSDGKPVDASTSGEVVLCAGSIGSSQLLMLSGIGFASHLRALGIDVVADLPAVGANLQDHPMVLTSHASLAQLPVSDYNNGEMYAAIRSELASAYPDLHLFPILLPLAPPALKAPEAGFALVAAVMAPDSKGSVRLATVDPLAEPVIDQGFLTEARDLDRLEAGVRIVRHAAEGDAFATIRKAEMWPGPDVDTSAGLRAYIRRSIESYYHPVGTCRMGSDSDAVVDAQLRVRGIGGLRVADASVIPTIPNANPNATVLAIAEKAAAMISGG
jgi:choline dehydrogenase